MMMFDPKKTPDTWEVIGTGIIATLIGACLSGVLCLGIAMFIGLPAELFWGGFILGIGGFGLYIYSYIRTGGGCPE